MIPPWPREGSPQLTRPPPWRLMAVTVVGAVLASLFLDAWVYKHVEDLDVYDQGWGQLFKSTGYYLTWAMAGLMVWLHEEGWTKASAHHATRRALLVLLAPLVSGGLDELIKVLVRRHRPSMQGPFVFQDWANYHVNTQTFSFPSSHTAVAFGGAFAMAVLLPRTRWIWLGLATGCAWTRIVAQAHYVSDTVFAIGLGSCSAWLTAWCICKVGRWADVYLANKH